MINKIMLAVIEGAIIILIVFTVAQFIRINVLTQKQVEMLCGNMSEPQLVTVLDFSSNRLVIKQNGATITIYNPNCITTEK